MTQAIATQLPLCEIPHILRTGPADPRPSHRDDFVLRRAAEMLYSEIADWLTQDGEPVVQSEVMEDLVDMLKQNTHSNGYELTKYLESRHHWAADSELVELLEDAWYCESKAIKELTQQWVKAYGITCPFKVGDSVRIIAKTQNRGLVGKITQIEAHVAECHVHTAEQEHSASWINKYEELELV